MEDAQPEKAPLSKGQRVVLRLDDGSVIGARAVLVREGPSKEGYVRLDVPRAIELGRVGEKEVQRLEKLLSAAAELAPPLPPAPAAPLLVRWGGGLRILQSSRAFSASFENVCCVAYHALTTGVQGQPVSKKARLDSGGQGAAVFCAEGGN